MTRLPLKRLAVVFMFLLMSCAVATPASAPIRTPFAPAIAVVTNTPILPTADASSQTLPAMMPDATDAPPRVSAENATATPELEGAQDDAPGERIIAAYFGIFDEAYAQSMSIADEIPWQKINRLYIAFATVRDGELTNMAVNGSEQEAEDRINKIVALYRAANAAGEIVISSNYGDREMDAEYVRAASDPQHFADSVLAYLQAHDLDGYDMDWESQDINDYADELYALLNACSDTFRDAGLNPRGKPYQVTHTIWPGVHSAGTVARLSDSVDGINLMTYGDDSADDLESVAVEYNDAGFPFEKMIAGVESEFGYQGNGGVETQATIARKGAFVRAQNLAGMFSWRLDNDMRTPDGRTEGGPPTFVVADWVYDEMSQ